MHTETHHSDSRYQEISTNDTFFVYSYSTLETTENVIDENRTQTSTSKIQVLMIQFQVETALSGRFCAIQNCSNILAKHQKQGK